ncbi:MAG: cob(I)yrinic acid a,c-diamide adenosyltransferase [Planctomycetes bacterium]|nr:cob(I)yrinic acid a,c-diamide adenosyltransferase [Planctomycetota bacterium]
MKLYTKTGDDGSTGLFGSQRVQKDDPRIVAFGSVDELNACVGLTAAADYEKGGAFEATLKEMLGKLQSQLFTLGADLATVPGSKHEDKITRIGASDISQLESWIDEIDAGNEPMKNFVLPGGTEVAARLHLARTVCRRAERDVISLSKNQSVSEYVKIYLNRLSDLLFALARRANKEAGVDDIPWISNK